MNKVKFQELIEQLMSENDRERRAASYKLGKSKDPDAVPALINAYNDTDGSVRQNVIEGLKLIRSKEAMDFLISHGVEKDVPLDEQPIQTTVQTVSKGIRLLNFVIDNVIYQIVVIFAIYPVARLVFGKSFGENFWLTWVFNLSIFFLYYFSFEAAFQRTPAKFLTATRVVIADGSRPDVATIAKRSLIRLVPFEVISQYTGKEPDLIGTWWHDNWTNTRVIKN
jgi:hypothetical protein